MHVGLQKQQRGAARWFQRCMVVLVPGMLQLCLPVTVSQSVESEAPVCMTLATGIRNSTQKADSP